MYLVDSNVLLDVVTRDPVWHPWSQRALDDASLIARIAINDVIYAEISVRYSSMSEVEGMLAETRLHDVLPIPREALFLAGKTYSAYRKAGGTRMGVFPDFMIGAHAVVSGFTVITRDVRRYRTDFPELVLWCPEEAG